jgi:hypothetical protein
MGVPLVHITNTSMPFQESNTIIAYTAFITNFEHPSFTIRLVIIDINMDPIMQPTRAKRINSS